MKSINRRKRLNQREMDERGSASCPDPCGKVRYRTRAAAKHAAQRLTGQGRRLYVYSGNEAHSPPCCDGFFHLSTDDSMRRKVFFRQLDAEEKGRLVSEPAMGE